MEESDHDKLARQLFGGNPGDKIKEISSGKSSDDDVIVSHHGRHGKRTIIDDKEEEKEEDPLNDTMESENPLNDTMESVPPLNDSTDSQFEKELHGIFDQLFDQDGSQLVEDTRNRHVRNGGEKRPSRENEKGKSTEETEEEKSGNDGKTIQEESKEEEKDKQDQGEGKEQSTSDMEIDQVGTPQKGNVSTGGSTTTTATTTTTESTTATASTGRGLGSFTHTSAVTRDIVSPPSSRRINLARHTFLSDAPALRIQRTHAVRYDIRVNVPPSENPETQLVKSIQELFQKFKNADQSFVLYPWKALSTDRLLYSIQVAEKIPADLGKLKKYFPRANPKKEGGYVYTQIFIGYNKSYDDVQSSIDWFLKSNNHGMWERPLQAEESKSVGWLLYSTREMDRVRLQDILTGKLQMNVGLRWRFINSGARGAIPREERVSAIHIEVETKNFGAAKSRLEQIYSSTATDHPLGISMRLIPEFSQLLSHHQRTKAERVMSRQKAFLDKVLTATTWDFAGGPDYFSKSLRKNLRKLIMDLNSSVKPSRQLIHSIDRHWQGNGWVLTFHPDDEHEVRGLIAGGMLPLLRYQHGKVVEQFFTPSAIQRAQSATYDPVTNTVTSPDDDVLDEALEPDDWDDGEVVIENTPKRPGESTVEEDEEKLFTEEEKKLRANQEKTKDYEEVEVLPPESQQVGKDEMTVDSVSTFGENGNPVSVDGLTLEQGVRAMGRMIDQNNAALEQLTDTRKITPSLSRSQQSRRSGNSQRLSDNTSVLTPNSVDTRLTDIESRFTNIESAIQKQQESFNQAIQQQQTSLSQTLNQFLGQLNAGGGPAGNGHASGDRSTPNAGDSPKSPARGF